MTIPCFRPARRVAALTGVLETGADGASEHARRPVTLATARTPVEQLVARGLLVAKDSRHLGVPREVGLALRGGHHCNQPLMRKMRLPGTTRASFYFYNTTAEVDRMIDILSAATRFFSA